MNYWGFPPYVTVAEKKAKAAKKLKQLLKKKPDIKPIAIEGRSIALTWWGKSWNVNLERYADYSNRIGRGRSYVRHGAVLDLQIDSGEVRSMVQGTASQPYSVVINIKGISKDIWRNIKDACAGKLESLPQLLDGKFPKALAEIFTAQGKGLFPSPEEIDFHCSCPDWASMCKHVAATLYGVGARLDEDPSLFFKLRKVEIGDMITQAVEDKTKKLLKQAKKKSSRVIDESDLSSVFGIEMEDSTVIGRKRTNAASKTSSGKKSSKSAPKRPSPKPVIGKPKGKTTSKKVPIKTRFQSAFDTVVGIVRKSRKGVTVAQIREKTGLDDKQIRNCIYKAKRQGTIKNHKRGVYVSS